MSQNYFSLDIGEQYIKLVDSEDKKKILNLKSAALSEIPFNLYTVTSQDFDMKASDMIRKLVVDAKISKNDVRITIPDTPVSYTHLDVYKRQPQDFT